MVTDDRDFGLPSEFADDVLDLVDQIPEGKVATYGDVAELVGRGGPRAVGTVMARYGSDVPWWRVIRAGGYPPQGLEDEAVARWREEATPLVGGALGRRVDLARARWSGPVA
jgi:alkylated DNA nucleotide flippase Atl1